MFIILRSQCSKNGTAFTVFYSRINSPFPHSQTQKSAACFAGPTCMLLYFSISSVIGFFQIVVVPHWHNDVTPYSYQKNLVKSLYRFHSLYSGTMEMNKIIQINSFNFSPVYSSFSWNRIHIYSTTSGCMESPRLIHTPSGFCVS